MTAWRSPWPQWRSHWHVWHAWPASAQGLVLVAASGIITAGLSWLCDSEAWQTWWQAEDEALVWRSDIEGLQQQVLAHQSQVKALQLQAHPSGDHLPAWLMANPANPAPPWRAAWVTLAQEHGLQAPLSGELNAVWMGPLANLLAAWQRLPQSLPRHAVESFELSQLPGTPQLELKLTWVSWSDQVALSKPKPSRQKEPATPQSAKPVKVALPAPWSPEAMVMHNPFATDGLRLVLPEAARHAPSGVLRGVPLSELRWAGMLQEAGEPRALVAQAGVIRQVQLGQAMGQDFGEVVQIASDHLSIREWHANALGQWQMHTTRFPELGRP